MDPNNIPQADGMLQFFMAAGQWLEPVVYLVGLGIAVWAYRRCHKSGYLLIACYFALVVLWFIFAAPVWRAIHAHDTPDISEQTQQKIDAAERDAANKILAQEGHLVIYVRRYIHISVTPVVLVVGVWLLARRETLVS
jgi:hypothetical protein